jgi:hypothetical protein
MDFLINALITNILGMFLVVVLVVMLVMSLGQGSWESKDSLSTLVSAIESKTLWETPGASIITGSCWSTIWWESTGWNFTVESEVSIAWLGGLGESSWFIEPLPCNGYFGFNCEVPTSGFPPNGGPAAAGYDGSTWGLPQGLGLDGRHESGKAVLGFPASLAQTHHKHHHKHHHQKHTKDIGDQGIDEEVHGFASADKSVLPQPWRRVKTAYPKNGFKNPSW